MNNKKKLIILGIIIILLIIIPIIVLGNIRILKYNEEGKPIVHSAKEMNELEDGTKFVLAVPSSDSVDREEMERKQIEEKKAAEKISEDINKGILPMDMAEEVDLSTINKEKRNKSPEDIELENKKQQIQDIIKKYYGTEYAENLFNNITKEINEQEGQYKVPESSKELLRKNIELYNATEITSEEREAIKYYLEIIDRSFIEDKDLLKAIESTGVESK